MRRKTTDRKAKVKTALDRHGGRTDRKGGVDRPKPKEDRNKITRPDGRGRRGGRECTVVHREAGLG